MATKRTGISRDLIIHPGETIADVLEERNITQVELAARTGVSTAYVSKVIAGKKDISSNFAMALEYALGVPKSFWLNLQANYEAELLELKESASVTEGEHEAFRALKEVIKYLRNAKIIPVSQNEIDTIISLRKALQMSNIANLGTLVAPGALRVAANSTVDPFVMGAWLRLCQIRGERKSIDTRFTPDCLDTLVAELKTIMTTPHADLQAELTRVMARYGIKFSVVKNFRGAPVHGFISQDNEGKYQMVLTIRGAYADIFWFSLFHELGHIVNGDVSKSSRFIDSLGNQNAEQEIAANEFAGRMLLNPEEYEAFDLKGDYSITAIQKFAEKQKVAPYIVIGRLQREERIPYKWYSGYKVRYKWA